PPSRSLRECRYPLRGLEKIPAERAAQDRLDGLRHIEIRSPHAARCANEWPRENRGPRRAPVSTPIPALMASPAPWDVREIRTPGWPISGKRQRSRLVQAISLGDY